MSTRERLAALEQLTADLVKLADVEERASAAKEAYRSDPTPETKEEHRTASALLVAVRQSVRGNDVRDITPGSVSITPPSVGSVE